MQLYQRPVERMSRTLSHIPIAIVIPGYADQMLYGESALFGAMLAIKHINASAKMRGRMLWHEVFSEEQPSFTKVAPIPHWYKLVERGHKFVVGHPDYSGFEASGTYEKEGILMITPTATSSALTTRGRKLLFCTGEFLLSPITTLRPSNVWRRTKSTLSTTAAGAATSAVLCVRPGMRAAK
jgi:hypothetical protein